MQLYLNLFLQNIQHFPRYGKITTGLILLLLLSSLYSFIVVVVIVFYGIILILSIKQRGFKVKIWNHYLLHLLMVLVRYYWESLWVHQSSINCLKWEMETLEFSSDCQELAFYKRKGNFGIF